ncbi:hypothetical protein CDL12_14851 [Handroanthus impetiginosus]|uniref:DUF4220 domain-containing protein n=1 Tax=Handroanthus impetiginosus TaxID=429701 RepID=A0A2G9H4U2_9LAMI|nr:hypothetical protein CDL12_14851 [Handroanthus impetiginosus]
MGDMGSDWAASFAVGIISSSQSEKFGNAKTSTTDVDILAYWAPFLLVHLGGPDTITAFSLEDNELWNRHMLSLIFQSLAAFYVFFLSLPKNQLWIPTTLMFVSGLIKYIERTLALFHASFNRFRDSMLKDPDPGPNYARLMDEYYSKKEANLPTGIEMIPEPARGAKAFDKVQEGDLTPKEVVLYAHHFFETFKGLIVDLIFSFRERNQSRDFFLKRTAKDAFEVVETELNFMYDVLFTKATVVYNKYGYLIRFLSFGSIVASLALFYCEDKNNFKSADIAITYTLLLGGIALDVMAFIKLIISDWLIVNTQQLPDVPKKEETTPESAHEENSGKLPDVPEKKETTQESAHKENSGKLDVTLFGKLIKLVKLLRRRWSESIPSYNLINYCLNPRAARARELFSMLNLTGLLDELQYVEHKSSFTEEIRDYIFKELKMKSELAEDVETGREISSAKGDWVLRVEGCSQLFPYIVDKDYDQSLLLWHIATELCYCDEINSEEDTANTRKEDPEDPAKKGKEDPAEKSKEDPADKNRHRAFSKLLSDYMLYLLIMQPTMMSAVGGIGQIRFRDTCAEANKFFRKGYEVEPHRCFAILYALVEFFKYLFFGLCGLLSPVIAFIVSLCVSIFLPLIDILCPALGGMVDRRIKGIKDYFSKEAELEKKQIKACRDILAVNTEVEPVTVKGDRSKSVLFDGCILAKELQKLENSEGEKIDKWKLMSKVWVEMLSYAAAHCRAHSHAQQLSKGGQLVTVVWLLMAHFGLGVQFQISESHSRAKLIVDK